MSDKDSTNDIVNRRTVLSTGAGATMAGIGWLIAGSGQAEANASVQNITASDVSVSTGDGELDTLTIDPTLTIEWASFPDPVQFLEVDFYVDTGQHHFSISQNIFDGFTASANGSFSPDIGTINLLSKNGGRILASEFADSTEGDGPEKTQLTVIVEVFFLGSDKKPMAIDDDMSLRKAVSFTVSVTNETASVSVSGTLNTSGS